MNKTAKQLLQKYLKIRKKFIKLDQPKTDAVFISNMGRRMEVSSIRLMLKKIYAQLGLSKKFSVHTLRHTCATLLKKNGVDLALIKRILGHASIETTDIYTHLFNDKIKDAMLNHPLAKFKIQDALNYDDCEIAS